MSRDRRPEPGASDPQAHGSGTASRRCVVSWSGGKDSALALHRARRAGYRVEALLTMFSPETGTSRSHGLPRGLLEEQAKSLGLPLRVAHASWSDYERRFRDLLAREAAAGVRVAVFGDIFLDDHKAWVERVCEDVGVTAIEPLWGEDTGVLAREILEAGIEAKICTVRSEHLDDAWLGEPFDERFLLHLEATGIDACGEHGEYHTVVVDGPDRARRLSIDEARVARSQDYGHWVIRRWHTVGARERRWP